VLAAGNPKSTGIHWAQSQATHVRNVTFELDTQAQTAMFMENGSGGWISDVVVSGGQTGLSLGNQQWTMRNVVVTNSAANCIFFYWNWVWTIVGLELSNCPTGIYAKVCVCVCDHRVWFAVLCSPFARR
jgi:glucan 1,3-beta-glucosidase